MEKKEGTLKFSETEGQFYITDEETQAVLAPIEFSDTFEVLENDKWVSTNLAIGSNPDGEMIFTLKNTQYSGNLDGIPVRK